MIQRLKIAVDFDDTLAVNNCYPLVGPPVSGAVTNMQRLAQAGHRLFIWTCRHGEALENAKVWLAEHEIPYERINENCPQGIEQYGETRKVSADIYIDDRNLRGLPPWRIVPELVENQLKELQFQEQQKQWRKLPPLIGLSGKRGSGKNTVATILQELMPDWWTERAFAEKLKYFAMQLLGGGYDVYSQKGKAEFVPAWGMNVGELLQKLGTDAIRNALHEQAWVLACFASIEEGEHTLITDVRFPNEADAIRARGGIVLRIEGDPLSQRGDGTRNDNHPSETALDNYTGFALTIHNTKSVDALRQTLTKLPTLLVENHAL